MPTYVIGYRDDSYREEDANDMYHLFTKLNKDIGDISYIVERSCENQVIKLAVQNK
jgi:hypothetical protein